MKRKCPYKQILFYIIYKLDMNTRLEPSHKTTLRIYYLEALNKIKRHGLTFLLPQSPVFQHRLDIRGMSPEILKHLIVIFGIAPRQDHVAEALAIFAVESTVFLEPGKGIIVQHFRPEVGVVASRIAIAPNVQEVTRAVARWHLR